MASDDSDEYGSHLLVSVSVSLEPDALQLLTERGQAAVTMSRQGDLRIALPRVTLTGDSSDRQRALEEMLAAAFDELASFGVTPALASAESVTVRIYISLCDGQATITLDQSMLPPWFDLGAYVMLDALG